MGDVSVAQLGGGGRAATSATSRRGAGTVPIARASWPRAAGRSPAPAADTAVTAGSGGGRGAAGWFCGASAAEHRDRTAALKRTQLQILLARNDLSSQGCISGYFIAQRTAAWLRVHTLACAYRQLLFVLFVLVTLHRTRSSSCSKRQQSRRRSGRRISLQQSPTTKRARSQYS